MKKPDDLKRVPGVFALLHAKSATAYVNETKDLRQRAHLWSVHLKAYEEGLGNVPAKDFPKYPSDEWEFWVSGQGHADTRVTLAGQGWRVLNDFKPRKLYKVQHNGAVYEGSLASHCKRVNMPVHSAYKRLARGLTVEQALGLADNSPLSPRELAIAQMRVTIESDSGGFLTYDEAIMMRPEIGDVREKLRRRRKKNPELSSVKLSEI